MLRYMADIFVGARDATRRSAHLAANIVSVVFGLLLLSAVNTALVDLVAISFLMSRDGELPGGFPEAEQIRRAECRAWRWRRSCRRCWSIAVKDVSGLADLYAVGVVGAIATNLGASSTDKHLGLERWERGLMFCTFLVMAGDRGLAVCRQAECAALLAGHPGGGADRARAGDGAPAEEGARGGGGGRHAGRAGDGRASPSNSARTAPPARRCWRRSAASGARWISRWRRRRRRTGRFTCSSCASSRW